MQTLKDIDVGGFGTKKDGIKDMVYKRLSILVIMLLCISGCVNLAASTAGTFIGNIASDRVIKELDKKETK